MAQSNPDLQSAVHLCAGVLPVWVRHLASSRTQSEAAVHAMLQAFSEMDPGLLQASQRAMESHSADHVSKQNGADLANSLQHLLLPHLTKPEDCAEVITQVLSLVHSSKYSLDDANALAPDVSLNAGLSESPVDRMYRGLQYQDRISQMMALLEEDMMRLQKVIADPQADTTGLTEWLARLETQYAMAEQRTNHSGDASASGTAASDETTFF